MSSNVYSEYSSASCTCFLVGTNSPHSAVHAGPDAVDWSWIAIADVAEVAAWLERVRDGRWWPERED